MVHFIMLLAFEVLIGIGYKFQLYWYTSILMEFKWFQWAQQCLSFYVFWNLQLSLTSLIVILYSTCCIIWYITICNWKWESSSCWVWDLWNTILAQEKLVFSSTILHVHQFFVNITLTLVVNVSVMNVVWKLEPWGETYFAFYNTLYLQ